MHAFLVTCARPLALQIHAQRQSWLEGSLGSVGEKALELLT